MKINSEKGGAVLITTILILLISAVIAMSLLNSSRVGSRVSSNYKLQQNAFNVAEAGFEKVRSQILSFGTVTAQLFCDPSNKTTLYDPNFNLYSQITSNSGLYGAYYANYPQYKGTMAITLPGGQSLTGEWYVRIIDNDLVCNKPLSGDYLQNGYLNVQKIKNILANTTAGSDARIQQMNGIMLNCRELNNGGAGTCDSMPTIDFSQNQDNAVFVESRGIIRQGTQIVASRLVRVLIRVGQTSGGGRNPSQKGGAAGGTRSNISGGTAPIGYGN
ncbi:MAG: hypothetical protein GXO69_02225 [Acidobacteria bacterium]|nr:hypothetical protein [Acidobacteriota bacterium]